MHYIVHADTRAWEVDTLRGHVNNVSCVMFHAKQVRVTLHIRIVCLCGVSRMCLLSESPSAIEPPVESG